MTNTLCLLERSLDDYGYYVEVVANADQDFMNTVIALE
jgi:hypothetical protein